jgi:Ca2+-binding RTX toxin-like protein
MVAYIRSDLDFILNQIKISEAHAAGQPLYGTGGLIPAYNLAWGLRTVDGSYNHLLPGQEKWGASDTPFNELLNPTFRTVTMMMDPDGPGPAPTMPVSMPYTPGNDVDGPGTFATPGDVIDPSVRVISNLLVDQTLSNPAAILTALQNAGVDDPGMVITGKIAALYTPLKPLFKELEEAARDEASAAAAAAASPGNQALQDAAAAAKAALEAAKAAIDVAGGPAPDGNGLFELLTENGIALDGINIHLPNSAPDEGLSAPFNSWFTLFGQFFDHGLDLVNKGGSGTVMIPLSPDDPLYVPGSSTNFMVLTRATVGAGPDGQLGTSDDVRPVNTTTAYVDQNQTYSSHASHQVFLRQYAATAEGPVSTGNLIEGANGGMATWGEVKAQARDLLGIQLTDQDVGSVPLLRTDPYGNFIAGPTGFPLIVVGIGPDGIPNTPDDLVVEGNPAANGGLGVSLATAVRTNHAFLADIAHNAVPTGLADGDITIGLENPGNEPGVYDNELLDAHFVAGDGRVNENVGLTAVHHVFHAEHNRLAEHTKVTILESRDLAFINEWLAVDITQSQVDALPETLPTDAAALKTLLDSFRWDGERLFQAAKFGNEMQYQHLVFEEFARKVQPNINVFLVPDGFDTMMDPTIFAEFAHVVYRFGHSMLTESIDQFDPNYNPNHISLIQGFLNPTAFTSSNGVDDGIAAGAIIRGMTRQVGNEIDEFVTSALRNNLLGLPLDLATINLARGRDVGMPSLNEARAQFYAATNQDALLKPYESWTDFAGHLKHEASIINFIAAYGTHQTITARVPAPTDTNPNATREKTAAEKRDAAMELVFGVDINGDDVVPSEQDRLDFLNATGAYAGGSLGGLNNVDLWIGGLAEEVMPFGGMLGSTFNFVFEAQMELLQSGDRFYYLQRLDGLHLFGEMENNSFAAMMMRNTDAMHLPSDVFSTPGLILEVNKTLQYNPDTGVFLPGADGVLGTADDVMDTNADPVGGGILTQLVIRNNPATSGLDTNYLRYNGDQHVVMGGTNQADTIIASDGDDTLYGDGGNDRLEGDFGNDIINGGDGDDIIVDSGGDDNIKAGKGNDVVHAGPGLDLVMGNDGQDFIFLGTDMGSEVFAGTGNDFIYGNRNAERILGNEGNDWIETGTFDGAPGDNFDEVFAHDGIDGHDVFLGDGGFDEFIGEGGDDIMVGSTGRGKMAGMSGFDWATYKDNTFGVNADLSIPIVFDENPTLPQNAALDEYASMEGLSGSKFNDVLAGSDAVAADRLPASQGGTEGYTGSAIDAASIALIKGLQEVLGAGVTSFSAGDIILGGDGSDLITGRGGDDIIDGDKWLDVQIGVFAPEDVNHTGEPIALHQSMTTLAASMFNGTINPGQLGIVRTIKTDVTTGDIDTAAFSGALADYDITRSTNGTVTVVHARGTEADGTDTLRNVEELKFTDGEFLIRDLFNRAPTGQPTLSDVRPTEGSAIVASIGNVQDADGIVPASYTYQWQALVDGNWSDIAGATGASFTPEQAQVNRQVRVAMSYTDGFGTIETVFSQPTAIVGELYIGTPLDDVFNGTDGDDHAIGLGAGDNLMGGVGNDTLEGSPGADDLDGGSGDDSIVGGDAFDQMTGGEGNDLLDGGLGADFAHFTGSASDHIFGNNGTDLLVSDAAGGGGTDTLRSVERLVFNEVTYFVRLGTAGNDATLNGTNDINATTSGRDAIFGLAGDDMINAGSGDDIIAAGEGLDVVNGGIGNDIVQTGAGADTITQAAAHAGRDLVDGGEGEDTYVLNGSAGAETFTIYSRAAALDAIPGLSLADNTEIVVARNGSVIAELDNIEEIRVSTLAVTTPDGQDGGTAGSDTIQVVGDFDGTSLNFNTITIDGNEENDTVDISALSSAHRIVFRSNGGNDTIVGTLRAQDVIELAPGLTAAHYTKTVNESGSVTLKSANHSVTYMSDVEPIIRECEENETGNKKPIVTDDRFTIKKGEVLSLTAAQLLANDLDLDGGTLSIAELDEDEHGTAVLNSDGTITFTPKDGFTGEASFTYMVSDGQGGTTEGMVTITVEKPAPIVSNPTPVAEAPSPMSVNGGRGNDRLVGDEADDQIRGGNGHDHMDGGAGADWIWGGRGNDTYIVDDRGDRVYESRNQGTDTVKAIVSYSLSGTHVEKLVLTGTADLKGTGNGLNNSLTGNSGDNVLKGGAGHDVLKGMSGNDKLYGGSGNDKLEGGRGNDHLKGGTGDDRLNGGSGNDMLRGGSGNDKLTGGSGSDVFVFEKKVGSDTITDFRTGHDKVDVSGLSGVDNLSDLYKWQSGSSTVVWHDSAVLVLNGVKESDLDSSDFIF